MRRRGGRGGRGLSSFFLVLSPPTPLVLILLAVSTRMYKLIWLRWSWFSAHDSLRLTPAVADPAWFRTLMRHSCLFEDERIRTVKAVSWWGPTGGAAAPAANSPPQSPPHRFVTSVGGKQAKTWVDGWPADRNSAVMFDGQTVMCVCWAIDTCIEILREFKPFIRIA